MKIRTLKQKILVSVSLALACAVLLLSGFAYYNTRQQLLTDGFLQLQSLAHEGSQNIGGWLEIKRQAVRALTMQSQIESARELSLTKQANGFLAVYLGDEQGGMRDENPQSDYSGYDPRTRPWYQQAKQQGDMITTAPYIDVTTKEMVITLAKPVANGVVGADLTITTVLNTVNDLKLPASGFAILTDRQGQIIAYSDKEKVLQPLTALDSSLTPSVVNQLKQSNTLMPIAWQGVSKLIWACDVPHSDWQLLFVLDDATLFAPLKSDLWQQIVIAALVLAGSLFAIGSLVGLLFRPLGVVSTALARIASGNGDLTQRIRISNQDEIGELAANFNQFVDSQHELISRIRKEAEQLGIAAQHGLQRSAETVVELGRQQQEIAMVATAVTEMASATQEIAHNAENTATAAQQSTSSSAEGRNLVNKTRGSITSLANEVGETTEVIAELSRHANDISSVLATIQGIAEQTNLLALNAAIEAARAGEQGRGFAVVADEVRVLSKRTATSTTEIQNTIETLQKTTQQAVTLMEKSRMLAEHSVNDAEAASAALDEITRAIALISDMSTQIATAAEEQTKVTEEITANVTAIKEVGDELAEGARQEQSESDRLQQQASQLNQMVARFEL
ncbi:methyl-accepting chemotaxis protein [Pseudaeromonas sharmana]|uniref:Methyl-accepting chemotaxis protein n=1 Tax=Pseudaeromonas sharmana TaxID=328412 RepID=A0ABV8CR72_9GAMM